MIAVRCRTDQATQPCHKLPPRTHVALGRTTHVFNGDGHDTKPWGREDAISTAEERINGCMERSMSGRGLPLNGAEMKAMLSYLKFLSTGIAVGAQLEGAGTLKLELLDRAADPVAGEKVYASTCVACLGDKVRACAAAKSAMATATSSRRCGAPTATTRGQAWPASRWPPASSRATWPAA